MCKIYIVETVPEWGCMPVQKGIFTNKGIVYEYLLAKYEADMNKLMIKDVDIINKLVTQINEDDSALSLCENDFDREYINDHKKYCTDKLTVLKNKNYALPEFDNLLKYYNLTIKEQTLDEFWE